MTIFRHISFRAFLPCMLTFFLIAGCASNSNDESAKVTYLFKKANDLSKKKDYFTAIDYYKKVLEDYPDSRERVMSLLRLGYVNYKEKNYPEAKHSFDKFIELYPAHPKVDQAHFYRAMSYFKVIELASRDQTATRSALEGFQNLVEEFPNSSYRPRALDKIKECKNQLAAHMLEIGKFYFETGAYQSAIRRFNDLLTVYPAQDFSDQAVFLLAESYFNEQNYPKARVSYNQLLDQYPESSFAKEALARLKALR
ncbi:MAG: outer membrane protein assembly factor BamD [Nitrospinales bacterium]